MDKKTKRRIKNKFLTMIAFIFFSNMCFKFRYGCGYDIIKEIVGMIKGI